MQSRAVQNRMDEQHLRRLVAEYFGAASRLRVLRQTPAFGAPVFVVDFDRGVRHFRTFGSFGPSFGAANPQDPQVTEQSSMDLLYPAHLVFHYERLMSLAYALVERPVTALLLGVGGGDVAVRPRLSAGMRADPGRFRRGRSRHRAALVLSEP